MTDQKGYELPKRFVEPPLPATPRELTKIFSFVYPLYVTRSGEHALDIKAKVGDQDKFSTFFLIKGRNQG